MCLLFTRINGIFDSRATTFITFGERSSSLPTTDLQNSSIFYPSVGSLGKKQSSEAKIKLVKLKLLFSF